MLFHTDMHGSVAGVAEKKVQNWPCVMYSSKKKQKPERIFLNIV